VRDLMYVERYSHVMHIVSALEGKLCEGLDALDAFAACFPAGTLSGAPKVRAMQIIEELEPVRRGVYRASGRIYKREQASSPIPILQVSFRKA
jgi:anthranilate synthase component 1